MNHAKAVLVIAALFISAQQLRAKEAEAPWDPGVQAGARLGADIAKEQAARQAAREREREQLGDLRKARGLETESLSAEHRLLRMELELLKSQLRTKYGSSLAIEEKIDWKTGAFTLSAKTHYQELAPIKADLQILGREKRYTLYYRNHESAITVQGDVLEALAAKPQVATKTTISSRLETETAAFSVEPD